MLVLESKIIKTKADNVDLIQCWNDLFNTLNEKEKENSISVPETIDDKTNFYNIHSQLRQLKEDKINRDRRYHELLESSSNLKLQMMDSKKEISRLKDINLGMLVLNDRFLRELSESFLAVDSDATTSSSFKSEKKTLAAFSTAGDEESGVNILNPTVSNELLT